jgi:hypothetical protein
VSVRDGPRQRSALEHEATAREFRRTLTAKRAYRTQGVTPGDEKRAKEQILLHPRRGVSPWELH